MLTDLIIIPKIMLDLISMASKLLIYYQEYIINQRRVSNSGSTYVATKNTRRWMDGFAYECKKQKGEGVE